MHSQVSLWAFAGLVFLLTSGIRIKQQTFSFESYQPQWWEENEFSNLHDFYNFWSLSRKKNTIHSHKGFHWKVSTSFYLLKHHVRIWRSTINSKHGAHLVQEPQSLYCWIWDIFSDFHIIYFHTFLTRHFPGTKIDRYICQFNFLQMKQKKFWLRYLYCPWNSVTIIWEGY